MIRMMLIDVELFRDASEHLSGDGKVDSAQPRGFTK
jgi:hypothetical protein